MALISGLWTQQTSFIMLMGAVESRHFNCLFASDDKVGLTDAADTP